MRVLVAYATRHGATAGIAERVAAALTAAGLPAEARPVEDVKDVEPYDAVVLGGAAYMFHWLGDATKFVEHNRTLLASHPTWLFSSGPIHRGILYDLVVLTPSFLVAIAIGLWNWNWKSFLVALVICVLLYQFWGP